MCFLTINGLKARIKDALSHHLQSVGLFTGSFRCRFSEELVLGFKLAVSVDECGKLIVLWPSSV